MGELSAEAVTKLLCTLPGIEQGLLAVMQTLATLATESADREARMKRKIGELAAEVKDLKEELVISKNSAIAWKLKTTSNSSSAVQADVHRTQSSSTRASKRSAKQAAAHVEPSSTVSRTGLGTSADRKPQGSGGLAKAECSESQPKTDVTESKSQTDVTESKPIFHVIEDDSWKLVSSERPKNKRAVVYVGNIATDSTESHFRQFIETRSEFLGASIPVHTCSVWLSESGRASARVTIDATSLSTVTAPNFWPRPVYCRPWRFLETSSEGSTSSRSHSSRNSTSASVLTKQQQQQQQPGSTSSSSPPPPPPPPPPPADFISTPLHSGQKRRNSHLSPPEAGDLKRSNGSVPQHDQHDAQPPQQDAQSSHAQ